MFPGPKRVSPPASSAASASTAASGALNFAAWLPAVALGGLLVVGFAVGMTFSTIYTYTVALPGKQASLEPYYDSDQFASPIHSVGLDEFGRVKNYTINNITFDGPFFTYEASGVPSASVLEATGDAVQLNVSVGGTSTVGLRDRPGVAGSYARPAVTVSNEGVVTAVSESPISADEVSYNTGNVEQSLNSNFLMTNTAANLPGSRLFEPNNNAFISNSENGSYTLTLRPRPLMGTSCNYPTQLTFDAEFGLTETCTDGPTPGMPGGSATLDGTGKLEISQLPDLTFGTQFNGLWDADTNTPTLTNASCGATDEFYYVVSVPGNTTLGENTVWTGSDLAICVNGTWSKIQRDVEQVIAFNGRTGAVVPQLGDYDASQIMVGNSTLDVFAGYGFVMWTASPDLPGGQLLLGTTNQIVVSGTTVSLAPKSNFPLPTETFSGYINSVVIDHYGRVDNIAVGPTPVLMIEGTPNQVLVSGTENVTLSLPQDIATTSDVEFNQVTTNSVVLGSALVTADGSGNATIPDVGNADFVMTQGTQSISGTKAFITTPIVFLDQGIELANAGNTFGTTVKPATTLAANTVFRLPPDNGALGQVLTSDGAGSTSWQAKDAKGVTLTATDTISSITYVTVSSMSLVTANTGVANYVVNYQNSVSTSGNNIEVFARITVNGSPTSSEIIQDNDGTNKRTAFGMTELLLAVAPGSTIAIEARTGTLQTLSIYYRSLVIMEV